MKQVESEWKKEVENQDFATVIGYVYQSFETEVLSAMQYE